jgi:hypothetical protein
MWPQDNSTYRQVIAVVNLAPGTLTFLHLWLTGIRRKF